MKICFWGVRSLLEISYASICLFFFSLSSQTGYAKIVINEIMYHPDTLRSDEEYIELYNSGSETVDLTGWKFSKGVAYTFPQSTRLAPGSFLLISPSLAAFRQHYGDLPVVGPYAGKLDNDGETLELVDSSGAKIDQVQYKDEEGWPKTADGEGPSLERIHPDMPSSEFQSWAAGPKSGTPGKPNAAAIAVPFPVVTNVTQSPVLPKSSEPVHITVEIKYAHSIQKTLLHYKTENETNYASVLMLDDGANNDGAARDGVWGADIPAYVDKSIVEFYVEAIDENSTSGTLPLSAAARPLFYLVDDAVYPDNSLPLYRIVMRNKDETELRSRNRYSNDLLPATFIYGNEIYHDVGFRFRGKGARSLEPKSYRIDFTNTRHFGAIRKLNLNADDPVRQFIGMESFKRAGIPAPEVRLVSLVFNRAYIARYIQMERLDKDMIARHYNNPDGNLYRGREQANLVYLGESKEKYRTYYSKITNELEDDYADVIGLCDAFTNLPADAFVNEIAKKVNIQEWIRCLAVHQILNDLETGIHTDRGDDYFIYNNPETGAFDLLPWDIVCEFEDNYLSPHHHMVKAIQRLLRHPDLARFYYQQLLSLLDNELSVSGVASIVERTSALTSLEERERWMNSYAKLCGQNRSNIPQEFTVQFSAFGVPGSQALISDRSSWRFFRGTTEPGGDFLDWTKPAYDDSNWESGNGVIGFGEAYIAIPLDVASEHFTTVFARQSFTFTSQAKIVSLPFKMMYDDGFIAYLNGVEIARKNMDGAPTFASTANSSHEANNSYEDFTVDPSLIVPGKNVLAIVAANINLSSSDLVMDAQLTADTLDESTASFTGLANAALARFVQVNKESAEYIPWTGKWSFNAVLVEGENEFLIEELNAFSEILDSTKVVIYKRTQPEENLERTLTADQSPYRFDGTLVVGATETLKIDAGVTLQFPKSAGIVVYGTLTVEGTERKPVLMQPRDGVSSWGGIGVDHAIGHVVIRGATFDAGHGFSYGNQNFSAVVYVKDSTAAVEGCYFNHECVSSVGGVDSYVILRSNTFGQNGEGVALYTSSSRIEYNVFLPITGYNDAIDFDGDRPPQSIIRYNHFMASEDDAIDMGDASPLIENNLIENSLNGKGLSLEGVSTPQAVNNVIRNCAVGIAIKDRCNVLLIHNTIVDVTTGISLYEKNAGKGGGVGTVINTVIWNVKDAITVDSLSSVTVLSSDLTDLKIASDPSNISKDPLFDESSPYAYFPSKESPLIDAGQDRGILADYRGELRPQGLGPDIGAYETGYTTRVENWMMQ